MTALPFEMLLGIYLGVLTGIIPALTAGVLGFLFKYFTDVSIPGLGVVLALGIAILAGVAVVGLCINTASLGVVVGQGSVSANSTPRCRRWSGRSAG